MSAMRDYAKRDHSVPKRERQPEPTPLVGWIALIGMGVLLGLMLGYGALYTGV